MSNREDYAISEIAEMFNINSNKIRFYEKKGLIIPTRHSDNKYRKYKKEDIIKLQSILLYRSIGLSISSIKKILNNNEKEDYLTCFNDQWSMINDEIHRLSAIRNSLEQVIDKIYEEADAEKINYDLMEIIDNSNKVNIIKNNWEDRWNFNSFAKSYDDAVKNNCGELKLYKNYDLILQNVYDAVESLNKENPKIIEIGVGTGNLASKFLSEKFEIIGIDQSREMLSVAKRKFPNLKVRLGEFLKIPYDNNTFDILISTYAFHHLNEIEKKIAIKEMIRVLKDNGAIIIGDLMFYSKEEERMITAKLSKPKVNEIKDEHYSYIDLLEEEFKKYNKKLDYSRVDELNYIIKVQ